MTKSGAASKVANSSIAESKLLSIIYQIFIRDENIKIFLEAQRMNGYVSIL